MTELWQLDAIAQADLVRRREVSALELVDAAIARIERIDPRLNAVVTPLFEDHDIWLTPTLARPPEKLGVLNQSSGSALGWQQMDSGFNPFNPWANISGCPSMSLPLHWSADGLPIGVLATARYGDEATLFRLAAQLEGARPWTDRWPAIATTAPAKD